MYDRDIEGRELTFGVSGKLIRNVLVMVDRQTESYWSQLLGEAVAGEMIGTKLVFVPSWMMTWQEWKALHPDTVALDKFGRVGARDSYEGYYASSAPGVIGETIHDDRLPVKELVVGVELENTAVAYPFSVLNNEPVINDSVDETNLLVLFAAEKMATAVYHRDIAGQTLTFSAVSHSPDTLVDAETGSTWHALTGVATAGPLAGTTLTQIKHTTAFWFGWKDWHTNTLVYGLEK